MIFGNCSLCVSIVTMIVLRIMNMFQLIFTSTQLPNSQNSISAPNTPTIDVNDVGQPPINTVCVSDAIIIRIYASVVIEQYIDRPINRISITDCANNVFRPGDPMPIMSITLSNRQILAIMEPKKVGSSIITDIRIYPIDNEIIGPIQLSTIGVYTDMYCGFIAGFIVYQRFLNGSTCTNWCEKENGKNGK